MDEITFVINTERLTIEQMNHKLVKASVRTKDHYEYKTTNSTFLRSLMLEDDFALMYEVVLLNHLFKSLIPDLMRNVCPVHLIYSSDLDKYDPDKTFAETIFEFVSSNKEYELLMIEFEKLIESYGFKCRANHIFVWQLIEVIDISDLNEGLYEFQI